MFRFHSESSGFTKEMGVVHNSTTQVMAQESFQRVPSCATAVCCSVNSSVKRCLFHDTKYKTQSFYRAPNDPDDRFKGLDRRV